MFFRQLKHFILRNRVRVAKLSTSKTRTLEEQTARIHLEVSRDTYEILMSLEPEVRSDATFCAQDTVH